MARIFWLVCPRCSERFYAHHEDFRHKKWKLRCPFCGLEFAQEESPRIDE